jgi:hypothetical protein
MNGQRCENCRFRWTHEASGTSRCRRLPPLIHQQNVTGQHGIVGVVTVTPVVSLHFWCGEYQPANPETVEQGAAVMARLVLMGDMTAARALADKLTGAD